MSSLARRVTTGALLAVLAAGLLYADGKSAPGWVPFYTAVVLSVLSALELARMGSLVQHRIGLGLLLSATGAALPPLAGLVHHSTVTPRIMATWYALCISLVMLFDIVGLFQALAGKEEKQERGRWAIGLALWVFPALFMLVPLGIRYGTGGLVLLVILSKIGDIFGYFVGRKIGKRHPFPNLSPGKTLAGCVASFVAGCAAGAVVTPMFFPDDTVFAGWISGALLGAGLNLSAQAGDLAESWVKRRTGVKDSSSWVGAAGGVLDVVDSVLFTAPTAVFLWPLVVG